MANFLSACCRKKRPEYEKLLDASDTRKPRYSDSKPSERIIDDLCVIASDQHTLSTIAEQVREATGGIHTVEEHLVTNRKAVAKLPIYTCAICCVRNAGRNISFNNKGAPEPDADLGFHAFDKMERNSSKDPSGVIIILVNHPGSQGSSELCMKKDTLSPRLRKLAESGRFLTVDKKLNVEQKQKLEELVIKHTSENKGKKKGKKKKSIECS